MIMKSVGLAGALAGMLLLSGCVTDTENIRMDAPKGATLDRALADANVALASGQGDRAQALLRQAAINYPLDKGPWLQLTRIKFDRASYGEAIVYAHEALRRDPGDALANGIVVMSGLRVSTQALGELNAQNSLGAALRADAQELARVLRANLGEELLVPVVLQPAGRVKPGAGGRRGAAAGKNQPGNNDPFGSLK